MGEPAPDLAFQHRLAVVRSQSLAVDDPHAAQSARACFEQKIGERIVRLVGRHAVQIVLRLDDPAAATKPGEHVAAQARAQKRLLALDLLPDVPRLWRRFVSVLGHFERIALVGQRLARHGGRPFARYPRLVARPQTRDIGKRVRDVNVAIGVLGRRDRPLRCDLDDGAVRRGRHSALPRRRGL